ncbi:MAG: 1,2-phenylacetyl-CoA epoxidase subunit PaaD [Bacteroidota bacterium]
MKALTQHTADEVWTALKQVMDPEIPVISLVDLNVIREVSVNGSDVSIRLVPTFSGCPALDMMRQNVVEKLRELGFENIDVHVDRTALWSTDELSDATREKLREFGIAPPVRKGTSLAVTLMLPVECPFCRSKETRLEGEFGATLCKQLFYCDGCRQSFERFKPL